MKILLIVDDDEDDRFFFCEAVRELGSSYACYGAQNGEQALQQLKETDTLPDVIFLDINMPLMSGKDCLIALKKDKRLKNIPVVIYSTSSYEKDIDWARKLGAAHFITKAFEFNDLPEEILAAIEIAKQCISSK